MVSIGPVESVKFFQGRGVELCLGLELGMERAIGCRFKNIFFLFSSFLEHFVKISYFH